MELTTHTAKVQILQYYIYLQFVTGKEKTHEQDASFPYGSAGHLCSALRSHSHPLFVLSPLVLLPPPPPVPLLGHGPPVPMSFIEPRI